MEHTPCQPKTGAKCTSQVKVEHTPTPWKVDLYGLIVADSDRLCINICETPVAQWMNALARLQHKQAGQETFDFINRNIETAQANAAHIVRCVNAHNELVKTLEHLAAVISSLQLNENISQFDIDTMLLEIETVLAKLK